MSASPPRLPFFADASVLVAGDAMLDRYWSGPVTRISPEAPVPVLRVATDETRAGGAANVALNVAGLGATGRLLAVTGDDDPGRRLAAALDAAGVGFAVVPASPGTPTIQKLRVLSKNQQLIRLDFEEALSMAGRFDRDAFARAFAAQVAPDARVGAVVLSDYGKGTLAGCATLIAHARGRGLPVLVDPKGTDWERYRGATLLTPNLAEFEAVAGRATDDADLVARAERLRAHLGLDALLVTRSERGMTLVRPGTEALHLPTHAREVYDVTGAGDTVIGTLAACLAAGANLAEACRLANRAAGVVVGRLGTVAITQADLAAALHADAAEALDRELADGDDARVLDEAGLLARRAAWRAGGERVVMTNGVFDLLHVGHVRYLEAARRLGDRLVVAVNTDASVRRLGKGPERPVNADADRLRVLAGLRCVDAVVAFAEDTPQRLIGRVLPDVLVKGGDYRPEDIAGGAEVRAAGGRVEVLAFHDGYSTTGMLARGARGGGGPAV